MQVYRHSIQIETAEDLAPIDITADVEKAVLQAGIEDGFALIYSPHTTFAIMLNEKESGLIADLRTALQRLVPVDADYEHDDFDKRTENLVEDESKNGHSHLRQMLAGRVSECIPVSDGNLCLGQWQRILAIEFDQSRTREVLIRVYGV